MAVTFSWDNQNFEVNNPEFGDSDTLEFTRIARQSRSGDTIIYRDDEWPIIRSFGMTFLILKESDANQFRRLLRDTLGRVLAYTHIDTETYDAVILNPDTAIKQNGPSLYEVALKLEVTPQP
jgi:hypothetical protein